MWGTHSSIQLSPSGNRGYHSCGLWVVSPAVLNCWKSGAGKWGSLKDLNIKEHKSEMCSCSFSNAGYWIFAQDHKDKDDTRCSEWGCHSGVVEQIWGQTYFRKMPNPVTPTAAWWQSCDNDHSKAAWAPVCPWRGKTKVVTGLYWNTMVGDGFTLSSWGGRMDLGGFSLWRQKLSDSFSGDCWISPGWSAFWSFLTKDWWCDGLSRAVTSVQHESSEL